MNGFNNQYLLYLESYLNEPLDEKYDINKMISWSEKFLYTITNSFVLGDDIDRPSPKRKQAAKIYKQMTPLVLSAIKDLYEMEYKLTLLQTQYSEYIDKFNISKIKHTMFKICEFLKEYIYACIASKWSYLYEPQAPTTPEALRTELYDEFIYKKTSRWIKPDKREAIQQAYKTGKMDSYDELGYEQGIYAHDHMNFAPVLAKANSNKLEDKIVGITILLNAFHDDDRGLVVAQPGANEEYPDLIIPLKAYEQASRIDKRKVEKELKQEIFGY